MHEMAGSFSSAEGAERSRMRGFRWRDTISPAFLEEERRGVWGRVFLGGGFFGVVGGGGGGGGCGFLYGGGGGGWRVRGFRWWDRISPAFLEEERRVFGDRLFRQEYLCEFVETGGGVFDVDLLQRAVREDVRPLEIE